MLTLFFLLLAAEPTPPAAAHVLPADVRTEVTADDALGTRVRFHVRNRTREDVHVFTGHARVPIRGCGTARFRARVGDEIRLWDGSMGGDVLFEVTAEMDDQTLDLADYHDTMARSCDR